MTVERHSPVPEVLDLEAELTDEGATYVGRDIGSNGGPPRIVQPDDVSVDVEDEQVTLTVSVPCEAEDHDGEDCECWEYVHSLGLIATS